MAHPIEIGGGGRPELDGGRIESALRRASISVGQHHPVRSIELKAVVGHAKGIKNRALAKGIEALAGYRLNSQAEPV